MANILLNVFPGFTSHGVVSDAVRELVTIFNAEGVEALMGIPEETVAWADVGSRFTPGNIDAKVPIRLNSLLGFEQFEGERKYHQVNVAAVPIRPAPWSLGMEWPIQIQEAMAQGSQGIADLYGISGLAKDIVEHGRALKADLIASLVIAGQTNSNLSMTASAFTIPQPGLPNGLPLFSDGSTSGSTTHYSNPLDPRSTQFANLFLNAGKITDQSATGTVMGTVITNMAKVPHPSKANMTLGLGVTDLIGGTAMIEPFWKLMIQTLSLQTTTSPGNLAVAATNIYNPDRIREGAAFLSKTTAALTPYRMWIAPQLDKHPYLVANPGKQMWLAVSQTKASLKWCEMAGPNAVFAPRITLLGDGSEEAKKSRKIRMFGDLDAGVAAGLPHSVALYTETTP